MQAKRLMTVILAWAAMSSAQALQSVVLGECEVPRLAFTERGQAVLTQSCEHAERYFMRSGRVAHSWVKEKNGDTTVVEGFCDEDKRGVTGWIARKTVSDASHRTVLGRGSELLDLVCRGPAWQ